MKVFNKALNRFSLFYPAIDIHKYQPYIYHNDYGNIMAKINVSKSIIPNKHQIVHSRLKEFLIQQYKDDMETLKIPREVLFLGRSNVGKSSLINALIKKNIGRISSKTGSTNKLHFHYIPQFNGSIVDSPGYGFSSINPNAVKLLQGMLHTYVKVSSRLCRIYLLLDIQHGLKKNDKFIIDLLKDQRINIQVVLTKSDKIKDELLYDRQLYFSRELKQFKNIHPLLHTVNVKTNFGVQDLQFSLIDSFLINKPRNLNNQEEQIIKLLQARKRPERLDSIIQQGGFQSGELYDINQITEYLGSLIKQDFPENLLNPENSTLNIDEVIKLILDLYQNINLKIVQSKQAIQKYHEEYQQILKQLADARANEKLNEYEIDFDSKVYVNVLGAKGLPFQSYFVKIVCFGSEIQTGTSVQTCSPIWNIQFQFDVPSPHGQIFVYLLQINQEKKIKKIGQLVLPLFSFKDQQHSQNDYILEDESGVLGNVNQKLTLIIWWVHSRVALIQDHLLQVNQFRKEIEDQNIQIQQNNYIQTILNNIFNKKNIKQLPKQQEQLTQPELQQQQSASIQQDWRITFQKIMYSIAKFFKSAHQDSIEEWQITVLILSIILSLFTILFIMIARPCIQQLVIVMSIGMLVWVYEIDQIKITRILGQISLILLFQCVFDSIWLILDYKVWWTDSTHLVMEQQILGNSIFNYISYFATIFYIPLDIILSACSYDLSLKYQQNIQI